MKLYEPMLRYIKKRVERPKELPELVGNGFGWLRWTSSIKEDVCPMGLLPCALTGTPIDRMSFLKSLPKRLKNEVIRDFYRWWDNLEDPQEAVDIIWGKS